MSLPRPGQEYTPDAPEPDPQPCTFHRDSLTGWDHHNPHEAREEPESRKRRGEDIARQCCDHRRTTRD